MTTESVQLVLLSGKGGTGKTSLSAAFAYFAANGAQDSRAVFVDADVDAANLSLVLQPHDSISQDFWGGVMAQIDPQACTGCGACVPVCRYDALLPDPHHPPALLVDPVACDGCAACQYACPFDAVVMERQQEGCWYESSTDYGPLYHAELFPGRENSGKLVTLIKQKAKLHAEDHQLPCLIIDGPPGIGCPVISACAGANMGLIVTEPGVSSFHDLQRVIGTLQHFRIPTMICINKADIHPAGTRSIHAYAQENEIPVVGEIPFDDSIPRAMLQGLPVPKAFPSSPASKAMQEAWEKVCKAILQ